MTKDEALISLKLKHQSTNDLEEIFHFRFEKTKKKIYKVMNDELIDSLDYEVYINSILVDCRAIFFENKRYKKNYTIQNLFRSRQFPNLADLIDSFFERPVSDEINVSIKEVIKGCVDQSIVHYDFLENQEQQELTNNINAVIDKASTRNIFQGVLVIAHCYEKFRNEYGVNMDDQIERTLSRLNEI